ncbi:MAG: Iron dependent repressor, N-terminal binding domain [Pseudonocardiales bacterium]|jgi:DtxR family Mn-dependent transcriptional regulator|nr:Iron dependent repressor, N-terminal binding domain [Pseudonocardiales bacterium]
MFGPPVAIHASSPTLMAVSSESERYSASVEDYLKVIYAFEEREESKVTTTRLAERLGVSASSVSGMVR